MNGGTAFNKTNLRRLITNVTYVGKVEFQGEIYNGEHKAIVPTKMFREAQAILDRNCRDRGATLRNKHGALLRGLLRCSACDSPMTFSPVRKEGKLYRYYRCSAADRNGHRGCPTKFVNADKVEAFVVDEIKRIGADPELQDETFRQAVAQVRAQRRGLKLELRRLKSDLSTSRADVQRLVETVSRVTGPAADAVSAELVTAQERVAAIEKRSAEIKVELATLDVQAIDRQELARALESFDPIWDVLLTPERERVLRLLIEKIDYDGGNGQLEIVWRLGGFGQLAEEIGS